MKDIKLQKNFIIGGKWLYYKIYCGVKTADTLLLDVFKPLSEELFKQKVIDKWFFIRYLDSEPHIRVRFHLLDIFQLGFLILKIKDLLVPYHESKQLWNIQLATYKRETKRYGSNTINEAEFFFYYDSKMILEIIKSSKNDEIRFLMLFNWLENMLILFNFEDKKTLSFLKELQEQSKKEFNVNKMIRKELSYKYRMLEPQLFNKNNFKFQEKNNLKEIVLWFLKLDKEQKLKVSTEDLLASFIHMSINRCFRSKQRLYEMMIYDFLYRKNKSKSIRYD
jgi:thiopeptide-type bacteriocin biosynthesis protein